MVSAGAEGDETITLTQREFDELLEYSASLPTGTTVGKRWKRQVFSGPHAGDWRMGEYVEDPDPDMVGVKWRTITIEEHASAAESNHKDAGEDSDERVELGEIEMILRAYAEPVTSTGKDSLRDAARALSDLFAGRLAAIESQQPFRVAEANRVRAKAAEREAAALREQRVHRDAELAKYLKSMDQTDGEVYTSDIRAGFRHALAMVAALESDESPSDAARPEVREAARFALSLREEARDDDEA